MAINQLRINATLIEKSAVRYTLSGIAAIEAKLHYCGTAFEAGKERRLEFDLQAITFDDCAKRLEKVRLGTEIACVGFIAPKSMKTQKLIVHITEFTI